MAGAAEFTVAVVAVDDADAVALLNACTLEIGCWTVAVALLNACTLEIGGWAVADDVKAVALLNVCTIWFGGRLLATSSDVGCWKAAVVCGTAAEVTAGFGGVEAAVAWVACCWALTSPSGTMFCSELTCCRVAMFGAEMAG